MKYSFIITIMISISSMVAMEPETYSKKKVIHCTKFSKINNSYYSHLDQVEAATKGEPSITLINNDKEEKLSVRIGNMKDGMILSFNIHQDTQMTLCPYLFPNSLNKQQMQSGTMIELGLFSQRLHCFVPYIDGNLAIDIKKGKYCHYIRNKNKTYFIRNIKEIKNGVILTLCNPLEQKKGHVFNLPIGGDSAVKYGDTIRVDYDKKEKKIHITHNDTKTLQVFPVANHTMSIECTKLINKRHTC